MTRFPPGSQGQIEQKQYAENRCRAHPESKEQTDANQQFDYAYQLTKEDRMRQQQPRQNRPVETDRAVVDVLTEIGLKSAVRKSWSGKLVFPEEQEKQRRGDAHASDRLGQGGRTGHQFRGNPQGEIS